MWLLECLIDWIGSLIFICHFQGSDYQEFLKAATSDNEFQFLETSSTEVAKVLFPNANPTKNFIGLVKSEPEKYTAFGMWMIVRYSESFGIRSLYKWLIYIYCSVYIVWFNSASYHILSLPWLVQMTCFTRTKSWSSWKLTSSLWSRLWLSSILSKFTLAQRNSRFCFICYMFTKKQKWEKRRNWNVRNIVILVVVWFRYSYDGWSP